MGSLYALKQLRPKLGEHNSRIIRTRGQPRTPSTRSQHNAYEMELPQVLEPYIKEGVHSWTGEQLTELGYDNLEAFQAFSEILDTLGAESGDAQNLKGPLTSVKILRQERSLGEQRR